MIPAALLSADLKGISQDFPATFVWKGRTFDHCLYSPGDQSQPPMVGGILDMQGEPTLVIDRYRFAPGPLPQEPEDCEVEYYGQRHQLRIASVNVGAVALTIGLTTREG